MCDVYISLDLKPALTEEQLDARVLRDFEKYKNKAIKNSLDDLLPKAMIPVIIKAAGINGDIKNNELKAENRRKIVAAIKDFRMYPHSLRDLNEAIVTSGGVSVKEIIAALNLAVVRIDFKACYLCIVNALELDGNSACCGHGSCRQNRFFGFGFLGNRLFGNNLFLLVKAELTRFLGKCHYGKH